MSEQMSLEELWTCPMCHGSGREQLITTDPEDDGKIDCRMCHGSGTVEYDPEDRTEIPF